MYTWNIRRETSKRVVFPVSSPSCARPSARSDAARTTGRRKITSAPFYPHSGEKVSPKRPPNPYFSRNLYSTLFKILTNCGATPQTPCSITLTTRPDASSSTTKRGDLPTTPTKKDRNAVMRVPVSYAERRSSSDVGLRVGGRHAAQTHGVTAKRTGMTTFWAVSSSSPIWRTISPSWSLPGPMKAPWGEPAGTSIVAPI